MNGRLTRIPDSRKVFYTQLLPALKAQGKAVLVITHDDKYFHLADRIVKLDYGRLIEDSTPGEKFRTQREEVLEPT